jgi:urease accessory protein
MSHLVTLCETQMMKQAVQIAGYPSGLGLGQSPYNRLMLTATVISASLLLATPAFAHHAFGGRLPINPWEGFLSGLAHPIIAPAHFAFVVAVGLLAVNRRQGWRIPLAFVLVAMMGAGLHVGGLNLPGIEILIAGSVLLFGVLLALKASPKALVITGLAGLAGLLHGYAYGEAIFGAGMPPLLAYLAGFTTIQLGVALTAMVIGQKLCKQYQEPGVLHSAGLVIAGVGLAFLATQLTSTLLPV